MRTITRYEVVKYLAVKEDVCPSCGRRAKRQTFFFQTLNPFNKTEDGAIKDRMTIYKELRVEAEAWQQTPVWHKRCEK